MATNPTICVKAFVDKGSNKVIFVEPGNDLFDTIFSYLTIPMGTVIELARKHSDPAVIGCMNNLYASVESIGEDEFFGNICKVMLHPRSAAEPLYRNINFKLHNVRPLRYHMGFDSGSCKFLSYESGVECHHYLFHNEPIMDGEKSISVGASQDESEFIKGRLWLTITDDLQVFSPSASNDSVFTQLGAINENATEEFAFNIGTDEILNMKEVSLNGRIGQLYKSIHDFDVQ